MKPSSLLLVLCLLIFNRGYAHNWYLSTSGDDGYNGSIGFPWKSVDKLNQAFPFLADGDSVFFKRGDVFYGNIRFLAAATSTIYIGAYGTGDNPVITGFTTVTGWSQISTNIWQATLNGTGRVGMLTINGIVTPMGRYPNRGGTNDGYLTYHTPTTSSSITDATLSSSPSWVGSEIVIRKNRWIIDRAPVTSRSGSTINFTPPTSFAGLDGFGYFFQNDPQTLDVQGEWYYNPSVHTIQMYSTSDPGTTVNASTEDTLLYMSGRDNLTFDNITFSGSSLATFVANNCQHLTIEDCNILYSGLDGVRGDTTSYITFTNNQILNTGNNALYLITSNSTFTNNLIKNSGLWPGMGKSDNQANMGMLTAGDNNLMQYNEIDSIGYNALYFNGNNAQVKNNFINQFCLTSDDGGGIYASGETSATGRLLEQNFVFNGRGNHNGTDGPNDVAASGIYLDDLSAGVDVESNSIANCSENGIFVHNGHDITVRNNTVYNAHTEVLYHHDVLGTAIRSISQYNNIFFSRDTAEVTMGLGNTAGGSNDFSSYGAYDSNYYCRPFNDTLNIQTNLNSSFTNYGLAGWTAAYGYDAHSNTSPSKLAPYAPQATGSAKFSNTTFDGGLTGFFALGNYDTLLIENKIDGNSLKFGTSSSTTTNLGLYFDIGSVTAGTKYLVTFKLQGRMDADFTLQLIENGGSFGGISELRNLHYNASAQEYDIVFNATSSTSSLLVLQFEEKDAPIWIDDLDVHTATMVAVNPDDFIKYLFNYQSSTSTVSLDGTYLDARGNSYAGSITLGAWSSAVLIKQPTAIEVYRAQPALQVKPGRSGGSELFDLSQSGPQCHKPGLERIDARKSATGFDLFAQRISKDFLLYEFHHAAGKCHGLVKRHVHCSNGHRWKGAKSKIDHSLI